MNPQVYITLPVPPDGYSGVTSSSIQEAPTRLSVVLFYRSGVCSVVNARASHLLTGAITRPHRLFFPVSLCWCHFVSS